MPRYAVNYINTASRVVEVDAANKEEAAKKADEALGVPSLCHHCAGEMDLGDWEPDPDEGGIWEISS